MDNEFMKKGIELLFKAEAAYLTTIDSEGFPSTRAMLNLKNYRLFPRLVEFMARYDELTLFFTTNNSSAKVKQIAIQTHITGSCVKEKLKSFRTNR
jgi:general stress protein 26